MTDYVGIGTMLGTMIALVWTAFQESRMNKICNQCVYKKEFEKKNSNNDTIVD